MVEVITRIALRYLAGALIFHGFIPDELGRSLMNDPELIHVISTVAGVMFVAVTELWYAIARRLGWST